MVFGSGEILVERLCGPGGTRSGPAPGSDPHRGSAPVSAFGAPGGQAAKSAVAIAASGLPSNVPIATPRPTRRSSRSRMMWRCVGECIQASRGPRASSTCRCPRRCSRPRACCRGAGGCGGRTSRWAVVLEVLMREHVRGVLAGRRAQRGAERERRQVVLAPDRVQELEDDALRARAVGRPAARAGGRRDEQEAAQREHEWDGRAPHVPRIGGARAPAHLSEGYSI